jgi:hypothetical protein
MSPNVGLFMPSGPVLPPVPPEASWWETFQHNRELPMPRQSQSWTCSICATDWTLLATGLDPNSTREKVAGEIGYPNCVNEAVGLADTRCLIRVFESYGVEARQEWVSWERAYELASTTAGVLNSTMWYHFVAIRGVQGDAIWIANSAPGYDGIYETINRAQFQAWAGSWQAVTLVH